MTFEEAMQRFKDAVNSAIYESVAVQNAWKDLRDRGIDSCDLEIRAEFFRRATEAPSNDQDFLRQLRITPDLEVRE